MKGKKKIINVYAFKVSQVDGQQTLFCNSIAEMMADKLHNVCSKINEFGRIVKPLNANDTEYALINQIKKKGDCYLIGFSKLNMVDGPAKGDISGKLEPFQLNEDEGFSNMCSALYDTRTKAFIVETSLTGLSQDRMLDLIYDIESDQTCMPVQLNPIVDANVYEKLNSRGVLIKKIELKLQPMFIPEMCYMGNRALKSVMTEAKKHDFDGDVTLVYQSSRSGSLSSRFFRKFATLFGYVQKYDRNKPSGVTQCKVNIKDDVCPSMQVLDLIQARITYKSYVDVGLHRMVPYDNRFAVLEEAYSSWKHHYFTEENDE